jgi:hypothetical protein
MNSIQNKLILTMDEADDGYKYYSNHLELFWLFSLDRQFLLFITNHVKLLKSLISRKYFSNHQFCTIFLFFQILLFEQ